MDPPAPSTQQAAPPDRVAGIDAYRGLVMFLMLAEVLHLRRVSEALPDSAAWRWLAYHQSHVAWTGCSLHDLIQPSFSFLVGVAVPYSVAGRIRRGQGRAAMIAHAAWRAFLLTFLGVFLRSLGRAQTHYTFEDTLSQIGLGYLPLFLLSFASRKWQWTALVAILVGYWTAFVLYPLPDKDFDYQAVGVPSDWPHHAAGLAAHFNLNSNLAWAFDTWFLNLFPRESPFTHNSGGYATLSFIPTLGTMILGLMAGQWLRDASNTRTKTAQLLIAGVLCLALGVALDAWGICPSVKKIWTPSWVLFSGGWCLLILLSCYALCDVLHVRAWAVPFMIIGANSITAYFLAHCGEGFVKDGLRTHLGQDWHDVWGTAIGPLVEGAAVLTCYFLVLRWLYRKRVFIRI